MDTIPHWFADAVTHFPRARQTDEAAQRRERSDEWRKRAQAPG
jgi:hypothetical protein